MNYCHLHVHSEKSWFDGIIRIPFLVNRIAACGMNAVALTDHQHVMGWAELERYATPLGVQALFGMELNIGSYHLTALAMNERGIENLVALNNCAQQRKRPILAEKEIHRHREGIFFLSGCTKGQIHRRYYESGLSGVIEVVKQYKEGFPGQFALEIPNPHLPRELINAFEWIAERKKLLLVSTNDCHFLQKEDAVVYANNLWLRTRGKIETGVNERYVKSMAEMATMHRPEWINNAGLIARGCDVGYRFYNQKAHRMLQSVPLSLVRRFDDIESMKMVYVTKKQYKLASVVTQHMKRHLLTLEDLLRDERFAQDVPLAFGIRGTIKQIEMHPTLCVCCDVTKTPLFKDKKTGLFYTQWTEEDAHYLNMKVV